MEIRRRISSSNNKQELDPVAVFKGTGVGAASGLGLEITGPETYIHENGHRTALELLYNYSPGKGPQVVDYQFDNVRNFLTNPSPDTLNKLLTMYTPQPNVGGYTTWGSQDGLSPAGKVLGANGSAAAVSAAGSLSELGLSMAEFAAGFKLRKTHPVLGYTLMTMSTIPYTNAVPYILSPLQGASANLSGNTGNDWVSFAHQSGINPAITGALAAASLPAVAAISFLFSRREKGKAQDRLALAQLIQSGKIPEGDLEKRFDRYSGKSKIEVLEAEVQSCLDRKEFKKVKRTSEKLQAEYAHFSDNLVRDYRPLVEEQKKSTTAQAGCHPLSAMKAFVRHVRESYHADKAGTAMNAGTVGSAAAAGAIETANAALPGALSGAIHAVPLLGIPATVAMAYRAALSLTGKALSRKEKAGSVGMAICSGLATAGALVPGLGLPFILLGLGGMGAISLARRYADRQPSLVPR